MLRAVTRPVAPRTVQGFVIPAVHTVLAGWIPPAERARAVSLTTSGLYLGSAIAMLLLPSVAARLGPAALVRLVGCLGLAWLGLWRLTLRHVRRRLAASSMPLHGSAAGAADGDASGKATVKQGRPAATPWAAMLAHPAGEGWGLGGHPGLQNVEEQARGGAHRFVPNDSTVPPGRNSLNPSCHPELCSVGHRYFQLVLPLRLLRGHELAAHLL